jgi:glucose/arabinose dehydrogenase
MRPLVLVYALVLLVAASSSAPAAAQEGEWKATKLAGDLNFPVDLAFGPDGTLYYAELRTGDIRAIPSGAKEPLADPVAHVDASPGGNGGFTGIALDPDFAKTRAFFVYYSFDKDDAPNGKVNRVSRVSPEGETVIVDDIPWAELHDGGRLVFTGPDVLVVTTGDNEKRDPAQDPDDLRGKTLRITREGDPAPGNPRAGSIIFTLGHRNPFGLAYDAENDIIWSTENGPDRGDEVNILIGGGNYGWPKALGVANDPRFVNPVVAFDKPIGPTGGTVLDGAFYFGDFNNGDLHRVAGEPGGKYEHAIVWGGPHSGAHALDVEAGPDGKLYYSTYDAIYVVTPEDWTPRETPPAPDGSDDAGNGMQEQDEPSADELPTGGTADGIGDVDGTGDPQESAANDTGGGGEGGERSLDTPGPAMAALVVAVAVLAVLRRVRE